MEKPLVFNLPFTAAQPKDNHHEPIECYMWIMQNHPSLFNNQFIVLKEPLGSLLFFPIEFSDEEDFVSARVAAAQLELIFVEINS